MPKIIIIPGNHAAAYACKAARVGVIAAYPITPQSPVVEKISEFVEKGEMPGAQYIKVESEQSAIAAIIAASMAGSRVFTASSLNCFLGLQEIVSLSYYVLLHEHWVHLGPFGANMEIFSQCGIAVG
jgi:pyruvate/2-oxoacid:ferredoxin oxidoreductase alpha subunit